MTFMHAGVLALQDVPAETDSCLEHRFIASVVGCSGETAAAARPRVCVCLQRYDLSTEAYDSLKLTSLNADCLTPVPGCSAE